MLIIGEPQKFLDAARHMRGVWLSGVAFSEMLANVNETGFSSKETQRAIRKAAKKLPEISDQIFGLLNGPAIVAGNEDGARRFAKERGEIIMDDKSNTAPKRPCLFFSN